ncbi:cell wall metabolism sensor histidine kinase WalK [Calidifontibacillus erzurumensis]|uniref:histidine kinase n=1 Tax=Calidifontibacillus erzurumensis TaxID=2741433 RepID=A0A8J8GHA2_9BACI|nr:cell wall metabolism sensor histidine kinase WalK [Calidifontibacillus erzurumensis]NSL52383.1 cell wall metabolism sensor histidine kinase WalK [Calidifontibacillus erzurumensis]
MKKVGFWKSIHFKFVLIYVLLILFAIQVIGVYFVRELEQQLTTNFTESVNERIRLLVYNIGQEMMEERNSRTLKLEDEIYTILQDFLSNDIAEVEVADSSFRVIGISNPYDQSMIGRRTTEVRLKKAIIGEIETENILLDPRTGNRMFVKAVPIRNQEEVIGAMYVVASMEKVYEQMRVINGIFASGTIISLAITALLGIFVARTITRPIADMRKQALVLAEGDFSRKVNVYGEDEIGQLAETFNELTNKLQIAQETTESEKRKLSTVLAHMSDGVIAADKDGNIILMNEPAERMLNVSRETIYQTSILSLLKLEGTATIEDLYDTAESVLLDFSENDKNKYILRASFSLIKDDHENPTGLITVLQDVTEQEAIEQERREFVANVSHELRTPLTTMRSYLEALADGAWQNEELAPRFIHVAQNETERMIRLVNDLLQLSRLDSKDFQLKKQMVNFTKFFDQIIDRFEIGKGDHFIFERAYSQRERFVMIDKDKITQVLDNIISNALKYSPEGGKIRFELVQKENNLYVRVTDDGVGIPKQDLAKVFDRFYRVDKARSRKMGGTGLGLAIAKEMVEIHGGQIWAESEEGKGTTITFTLPLEKEREEDFS